MFCWFGESSSSSLSLAWLIIWGAGIAAVYLLAAMFVVLSSFSPASVIFVGLVNGMSQP